jgi:hypothetical protein
MSMGFQSDGYWKLTPCPLKVCPLPLAEPDALVEAADGLELAPLELLSLLLQAVRSVAAARTMHREKRLANRVDLLRTRVSSDNVTRRAVRRGQGKAVALPGLEASLEVVGVVAARLEHDRCELATVSDPAHDDDRALAVELVVAGPSHQVVQREMHGPVDAAGVPLVGLAHVDHLDRAPPLQLGHLLGLDVHGTDGTVQPDAVA